MSAPGIRDAPIYTIDEISRQLSDVIQRKITSNVPFNFSIFARVEAELQAALTVCHRRHHYDEKSGKA